MCFFGPRASAKYFRREGWRATAKFWSSILYDQGSLFATPFPGEHEVEFLNSEGLQTVISQSSLVIARSGYSTIMDLAVLGKKGILVPTPGQTEQEYLADRWKEKGVFYSVPQHDFNLYDVLEESKAYTGLTIDRRPAIKLLNEALDKLLNRQYRSNDRPLTSLLERHLLF